MSEGENKHAIRGFTARGMRWAERDKLEIPTLCRLDTFIDGGKRCHLRAKFLILSLVGGSGGGYGRRNGVVGWTSGCCDHKSCLAIFQLSRLSAGCKAIHEPSQRGDGDGSSPSSSTVLCGGYAQTSYDSPSRKKYLKASHLPRNRFRSLVLRSQMAESEIRGLVTESRPFLRHMFALFFLISPGGKEIDIASPPEPRIASHRCLAR
jgi:hypothetical protein